MHILFIIFGGRSPVKIFLRIDLHIEGVFDQKSSFIKHLTLLIAAVTEEVQTQNIVFCSCMHTAAVIYTGAYPCSDLKKKKKEEEKKKPTYET